jgi:hypothetical protein
LTVEATCSQSSGQNELECLDQLFAINFAAKREAQFWAAL